ncbi:MAG: AraC family transcriptional regulator [Rubrivivax sp.]|nr:AraC family transcriptional regulator [Rubrivivax sp.]
MADVPNLANIAAAPGTDYVERINRAIDHVLRHLAEPLPLDEVARAAHFSPYHFHRIFKALVGETVHDFVKRVRLEHALHLLSHREGVSLTEVALACGFASSSDFSRSFRSQFGVPPSAFDVLTHRRMRREQMVGALMPEDQRHRLARLPPGQNPDGFVVRLRQVPARRVAYLRVFKPYAGDGVAQAARRLVEWAAARGLAGGQWLGYQWDDPEIVPLDLCRYDVGLEIPEGAAVVGDVSVARLPPMTLAELDIAGPADLEMRALDWLFTTWLPTSGYAPDHQPCFEAWVGEPFAHGYEHFELCLQLPVVAAGEPI